MTATSFSEKNYAEQLLLRALVVSLLVHVLVFGTYRVGARQGWWRHFSFPSWMHVTPKLLMPMTSKQFKLIPRPKPAPSQLVFVDVDPALSTPEPPKQAKYYSANNSVAANPHPKNLNVPEILGRQTKVMKTTPDVKFKPQPLQPSPPQKEVETAKEAKPLPKKAWTAGDFVMAKPAPKAQEKESTTETSAPGTDVAPKPVHHRPRTIAEAMAEHGMLGEKAKQDGGVNQVKMDSTLDAMKTSYGDYDREFIDAVRTRWYQLLGDRSPEGQGTVVVEFVLHSDGRITNVNIVKNQMSDLLGLICSEAITDPAPYRKWPEEMRRDFARDTRDVTFTFYYSTE